MSPVRILLVEDTKIAQMVAKAHLAEISVVTDIAENSVKAMELTNTIKYDLILMDIGLGEGPDGFDVTRHIKNGHSFNKDTPIIALTSHGDLEMREKAREVGMVYFICKPFSTTHTHQVLEFLMDK